MPGPWAHAAPVHLYVNMRRGSELGFVLGDSLFLAALLWRKVLSFFILWFGCCRIFYSGTIKKNNRNVYIIIGIYSQFEEINCQL